MGRITLKQAAQWCGGTVEPQYENVTFFGACNDTRVLQPGELFVALQGARDGNEYVSAAMEKGAAAALCSRKTGDFPAIYVEDTRLALGKIAAAERRRLGMTVVGITGSVGKSTTKEMVAAVLQTAYRTGKTPVNHNNDIGMPMAVLALPEDTEVAVLEMGMNHFREMAYLSEIAAPDLAVIVNIGTAHIEFLGSTHGIRQAKLEILEGMKPEGKLLLNGDDVLLHNLEEQPVQPITYFGGDDGCALQYSELKIGEDGIRFAVSGNGHYFPVHLNLEGKHFVPDAMAAIAVGLALNVSSENIRKALEEFRNLAGRQETLSLEGVTIIKDCYNAGPESMAAALQVLGSKSGRRIAVLGDMLELGVCASAEHYRLGREAAEKADVVLALGEFAPRIISGCLTGGMQPGNAKAFTEHAPMAAELAHIVKPGDTLLFKGSHGVHMEKVLELFLKTERDQ